VAARQVLEQVADCLEAECLSAFDRGLAGERKRLG
jgi:hypothetical protein